MPQQKHKPEEIVAKLRHVDVLLSQGRPVAEAIRTTGARQVDVSSGVETAPGVKDAQMIADFVAAAQGA